MMFLYALLVSACFAAAQPQAPVQPVLGGPLAPLPNGARHTVSLAEALDRASKNNLDLIAKMALLDQAEARQRQAHAASFPKVIGTAILSPIYSATGDALRSENDLGKWGAWLQSTVTILQPLYMWGKLSSLREAAENGSEVARAQSRKDIADVAYTVKELYYGATLAEELSAFFEDGKNDIDDVLKKAETDQSKKRPTIRKRDYYRLKIFAAEADYRYNEALKLRYLARHALSLALGYDPNDETIPTETSLKPIVTNPPSEEQLVNAMIENRPEFSQLTHGIAAKKALLSAESANKYPMLFAGGMLTFAYSNVRTGQQSAYAFDPYNRSSGGVGMGVQWNWDFATTLANEAMMRAEIDELEKKQNYARAGFRMELKKVLADLAESRKRLDSSQDAMRIGKRWLVSETMGYSLGTIDIKDLIDAYLARAKTAKDQWEAIYKLNMTWAELCRIVGKDVAPK